MEPLRSLIGLGVFLLCVVLLPSFLQEQLLQLAQPAPSVDIVLEESRVRLFPALEWDALFPHRLSREERTFLLSPSRAVELYSLLGTKLSLPHTQDYSAILLWDPFFVDPAPKAVCVSRKVNYQGSEFTLSVLVDQNLTVLYVGTDKRLGVVEGDFVNFRKVEALLEEISGVDFFVFSRTLELFRPLTQKAFWEHFKRELKVAVCQAILVYPILAQRREHVQATFGTSSRPLKEKVADLLKEGDWRWLKKQTEVVTHLPREDWYFLITKHPHLIVRRRAMILALFFPKGRNALLAPPDEFLLQRLKRLFLQHPFLIEESLSVLLRALEQESADVRFSIALLLSRIPCSLKKIQTLLYHPEFSLNLAAAYILWHKGRAEEVLPIFYAGLQYPALTPQEGELRRKVQWETLRYIAKLGKEAREYFLPYLQQISFDSQENTKLAQEILQMYR